MRGSIPVAAPERRPEAQVRHDGAMAEGSGAVWTMQVSGNHDDGSPFITAMFTYAFITGVKEGGKPICHS